MYKQQKTKNSEKNPEQNPIFQDSRFLNNLSLLDRATARLSTSPVLSPDSEYVLKRPGHALQEWNSLLQDNK